MASCCFCFLGPQIPRDFDDKNELYDELKCDSECSAKKACCAIVCVAPLILLSKPLQLALFVISVITTPLIQFDYLICYRPFESTERKCFYPRCLCMTFGIIAEATLFWHFQMYSYSAMIAFFVCNADLATMHSLFDLYEKIRLMRENAYVITLPTPQFEITISH
jgi:hypothetical protein